MDTTTSRSTLPVFACVTAYNEEATVGGILETLLSCPSVDHVQLVDDASEDRTSEIGRNLGVEVRQLPKRVPVGEAIMHHLDGMPDEAIVLWCDADLVGLRTAHIEDIVATFRAHSYCQVTSSRGVPPNWPGWARNGLVKAFWGWLFGPISGERAILKSDFEQAIELSGRLGWSEMMRGYGIVLFLNWFANVYRRGSTVRYFDDLRQRQKYQKWGGNPVRLMLAQWMQFIRVWIKIRVNSIRIRSIAAKMSEDGQLTRA